MAEPSFEWTRGLLGIFQRERAQAGTYIGSERRTHVKEELEQLLRRADDYDKFSQRLHDENQAIIAEVNRIANATTVPLQAEIDALKAEIDALKAAKE